MTKSLRALLLGVATGLATLGAVSAAAAQGNVSVAGEGNASRRISMGIGKSVIVDLPQDAAEIFVGNPKVANAIVRSARKLYVIGIDNGQTTLFAMNAQGQRITTLEISIGRDIGELQQILHIAMPTATVVARTVNDSIILTGVVDSAEEAQRAADIAKGFVQAVNSGGGAPNQGIVVNSMTIRGRDQVTLKVSVAEMRRDIAKQLGVTSSVWGPLTNTNSFAISGPLSSNSGLTLHNPTGTLSATLQAFERQNVARVLAEPTVAAVSGESAKFTVGGEFPYPAGLICGTGGGACVAGGAAFKNYGITLNFSPVVLAEGRILLHIATEVTEIDFQHAVNIQGVPTPGLRTRKNETTVELPSGGSIATAGLLQATSNQVIQGFPGLLNLPILGALFRSRDYQRDESELLVIVTPYITKPVNPQAFAKPDDGFADSSDPQAWLLGRVNRLYASPNNPEAIRNYRGRVGFIQD